MVMSDSFALRNWLEKRARKLSSSWFGTSSQPPDTSLYTFASSGVMPMILAIAFSCALSKGPGKLLSKNS